MLPEAPVCAPNPDTSLSCSHGLQQCPPAPYFTLAVHQRCFCTCFGCHRYLNVIISQLNALASCINLNSWHGNVSPTADKTFRPNVSLLACVVHFGTSLQGRGRRLGMKEFISPPPTPKKGALIAQIKAEIYLLQPSEMNRTKAGSFCTQQGRCESPKDGSALP